MSRYDSFVVHVLSLMHLQWSSYLFPAFRAYTVNCDPLSESDFSVPLDHVVRPHLVHWLAFREAAIANIMQTLERKLFTYCNNTRRIEKPPLNTLVASWNVARGRHVWENDSAEQKEGSDYNRETLKPNVKT